MKRARVVRNVAAFYKIIADQSTSPFDYHEAAVREVAWWDIHRKSYTNNPELEESLAKGAAVIYGVSSSNLKTYAHYRAVAMMLPRHEGDKHHAKPTDWQEVHSLLQKSWRSLRSAVR